MEFEDSNAFHETVCSQHQHLRSLLRAWLMQALITKTSLKQGLYWMHARS